MLDRNEVALRFAVADYGARCAQFWKDRSISHGSDASVVSEVATGALRMADAFLAEASKPAPSPAVPAQPVPVEGAYVPKVGDVVRVTRDPTDEPDEWLCFLDHGWPGGAESGIVVEPNDFLRRNGKVAVIRLSSQSPKDPHGVEACRLALVRPATPAERIAAGIDKPTPVPPVDPVREAERAVVEAAERYVDDGTVFEVDIAVNALRAARKAKS